MKKLVIFDLDGTLLNTIADLAQSTNHALSVLGYPTHEESAYNFMVGNGINKLFERALPEGAKPQTARTPVFPSGWQDQFGLPYKEHQQSMQVNIFDGYAVYSIKESSQKVQIALPDKSQELPQQLTMEEM